MTVHSPAVPRAHALPPRDHDAPSVFRPENMLREARRQKGLDPLPVPDICVLDPDGDIVRHLRQTGRATPHRGWACYHTELDVFDAGRPFGIVGRAVGAPFAVLVAEQLFASGCRLLLSITSAGRIAGDGAPFILIEQALRDEGTSHHYLPDAPIVAADPVLVEAVWRAMGADGGLRRGLVWTTDAPFRETELAVAGARAAGALAVEMEAAALYAFARARGAAVLCLAHVTNELARAEGEFEKGEADGAIAALALLRAAADAVTDLGADPMADMGT
jgi:uridine phosphorylase